MRDPQAPEFHVTALSCAAAIMASGCDLAGIDTREPGRCRFKFIDPRAPQLAKEFAAAKLQVNAKVFMRYFDALRTMVRKGGAQ